MAGRANCPAPAMAVQNPLKKPVAVIGPQFLTQYPVDLTIANDFRVTDVNGTLIFSLKSKFMSIHARQHLKDAAGNIVVSLKQKIRTLDGRWQVLRGESTDEKDLLFSVKKPSLTKKMTQLDVFLASNTSERVPDFKVKGSTIYLGDGESNVILARMFKGFTDNFVVTVYPNVDYAFIVAMMVTVNEINATSTSQGKVSGMEVAASSMDVVAQIISAAGGGG